ncbi:MAG: hemerythrin domain-containing protein [Candidatus Hodarchaeota archaeon]
MQPLERLAEEHQLIEKAIFVTQEFRREIKDDKVIQPKRYWMLIDFWSTFADIVHHGKEEQQLFPAIERQGGVSEFGEIIDQLVEEHMRLLGYISDLRRHAKPMFTGNKKARQTVLSNLESYVKLIIPHIKREDEELFPAAANLLSRKEMAGLAKEFKTMDARTRPQVLSYYRMLLDKLMEQ